MTSILTIILIFGGAIFFHELGHYLVARKLKQETPEFAIGFGPTIFSYTDKNNTKWMLKLLPLGGYVKIPNLDPNAKVVCKPLDRILIALAGPLGNFATAFTLAVLLFVIGWKQPITNNIVGWATPESAIQPGDTILEINNQKTPTWEQVGWNVFLSTKKNESGEPISHFKIKKENGEIQYLTIITPIGGDFEIRQMHFSPTSSTEIGGIMPGSPAQQVGLQKNDVITSIDTLPVYSTRMVSTMLKDGKKHDVTILRNQKIIQKTLYSQPAKITNNGKTQQLIGVYWNPAVHTTHPNPFQSIQKIVSETFRGLEALINPKSDIGIKHMSSAPGIMKAIHKETKKGIGFVLWTAILININLGILNLLPIPVLDGGHITLAIIEKLKGNPIPEKLRKISEVSCFLVLISLMLYISVQDIRFWDRGEDPNADHYIQPQFENPN